MKKYIVFLTIGIALVVWYLTPIEKNFLFNKSVETMVQDQVVEEIEGEVEEAIEQEHIEIEIEEEPEPEPVVTQVTVLGVGDNLIHAMIYVQARLDGENGEYDFTNNYKHVEPYISKADIASINQETMMAASLPLSTYPKFNSPIEIGDKLVDLGFDVVSLSNNHMYDMGEVGLRETLDFFHSKEELTIIGAYYNEEEYLDIPLIEKEGIVFSFVASSQWTNGLSLPQKTELVTPLIVTDSEIEEFLAQIKRAKEISDIVVANVHWGYEYKTTPNEYQTDLGIRLAEAGADIILGHHPHVIQPVEYLTTEEGRKAVVCYSLGNFISTQESAITLIGGMLDVTVEQITIGDVVEEPYIAEVEFIPIITHYVGNKKYGTTIYPFADYTEELAAEHGIHTFGYKFSIEYIDTTIRSVVEEEFLPDFMKESDT